MRLVEVIALPSTSQHTIDTTVNFTRSIGKIPVLCKDTPGFMVNKLLYPYFLNALRMYEEGIASVESIDLAMKNGADLPIGPFKLMDMIGIDVVYRVVSYWHTMYPDDPRYFPTKTLSEMVRQHKLGMKTRQGFYTYKPSLRQRSLEM